jgi:isopenicillin-N epimerase
MQKVILSSAGRLVKMSSSARRCQHTKGYQAMGSFHSENVDVLMAQTNEGYQPPPLPFDDTPSPTSVNPCEERGDFLLDPKWTFLNHGAFGASLRVGYERAEQWRYHLERQPLRYFDRDLLPHLAYSARQLADFCQASDREALTLIPNVTYGLNTVIRGYVEKYQSNAHIILWDTSYGSLKKIAAEYCDKVTEVPVSSYFDRTHQLDNPSDIFEQALSDNIITNNVSTENALLILDHTTSNTAINMPLQSLTKFAKQRGMLVMVDGAHGLLANPITLNETLPVDFYLSNGHKWLSCPRGIAMMYCPNEELRDTILRRPAVVSHGIGQGYQSRFLWDGCRDYAAALCKFLCLLG